MCLPLVSECISFHSTMRSGLFFPWTLFLSCTLMLLLLSVPYYLSTAISCNITESQRINYIITISRWAQFCWLAVFCVLLFYFIFHGISKKKSAFALGSSMHMYVRHACHITNVEFWFFSQIIHPQYHTRLDKNNSHVLLK